MYDKQTTKNILISLALLISVALVFWGGAIYGSKVTYKELSVPNLKNKDAKNIADSAVDFAPFWKAWNILDEKYVKSATGTDAVTDQDRVWGAISGLAASLDDPYTVFFPPQESQDFSEQISGNFGGIGAELSLKEGNIVVVSPLEGSPAKKAGLQSGDMIVLVDGKSTAGFSVEEAILKIRGEVGTKVTLTVSREGSSDFIDISIVRDNIEIPIIETKHLEEDGVFVISLYSFTANSAYRFREALSEFALSKEQKLIIDLRGNPGGYLEAAIDMASWFLPEGKVIVKEDFGEGKESYSYRSKGFNTFGKSYDIAILIDGGSASASEILAGALNEYGVATLVGTKSFGKGSVQELVDITPETSLKVTVARWLTPLGKSISQNGLEPDVVVEFDKENFTKNGTDNQLMKAVEILKKK